MARKWDSLLTTGNPKIVKGEKAGYFTGILHLAPMNVAGCGNVCPWATKGCAASCLNTAGRGGIIKKGEHTNNIQEARKERTRWLFDDPESFHDALDKAILMHKKRAARYGMKPAIRLNGTSDLDVEKWDVMKAHQDVQFYDYTKSPVKAAMSVRGELPSNYHVTFSRAETVENQSQADAFIRQGVSVAVVFSGKTLPTAWRGKPVVDGDATDLRFLDPAGAVVGLRAKGKGRKDTTGFVVSA